MIIKNAILCDKRDESKSDLRIENGVIRSIGKNLVPKKNEETIDARGMYLLPGAIDLNSSLGKANQNIAKTLQRVESDALKGGVCTVVIQPKTPINTEIGLDYLVSKSKEFALGDVCGVASAIENNDGDKLNNMAIMFKNGAVGAHINSDANINCMRRSMEYSAMFKKPLFISLQNKLLDLGGVMNDSEGAFGLGLTSFQNATESTELVKICELSANLNSLTAINSISLSRSVELAKTIRNRKEKVQFCTDLHFFAITDSECLGYNSFAKNNPPLRTINDTITIKNAIKNGIITCVASGHSPVSIGTKDVAFEDASFGIESLALFLPICYTYLVKDGTISMSKLSEIISYNPAQTIGLENVGLIKAGFKADLVLFDPTLEHDRQSVAKYDSYKKGPYYNKSLSGFVSSVFKNGKKVI